MVWKAYQNNTKETWDVILSSNDSTKQLNISYPSQGCIGIWNINYIADDTIYFTEHILYGKDKCVDLMVVELKIISVRKIELKYYYHDKGALIAKVILEKL